MRKNATKLAAAVLSLAMVMTSVSMPASAAKKKTTKINKSTATLYTNGSKSQKSTTLYVTVGGKKVKATFKSSNTKILTVAKKTGKVTAKKPGKATVTATYKKKNYKCTVTVKAYATSVKVSPTSVNLVKGKTKVIKATVSPSNASNKKVSFSSSNKAVATVSSTGKITAKKAGTAKITVTALGSKNDAKKAYVTVKVTNPAPAAIETPVVTETPAATETPVATVTPSAVATEGTITITTNVSGASVKVLSTTASGATIVATYSAVATSKLITTATLKNGTYEVVVSKEGYEDATKTVVVNGDVNVDITLVEKPIVASAISEITTNKATVVLAATPTKELTAADFKVTGNTVTKIEKGNFNTVYTLTLGTSLDNTKGTLTVNGASKTYDFTQLKINSVKAKNLRQLAVTFSKDLKLPTTTDADGVYDISGDGATTIGMLDNLHIWMTKEEEGATKTNSLRSILYNNANKWKAYVQPTDKKTVIIESIDGSLLTSTAGTGLGLKKNETYEVEALNVLDAEGKYSDVSYATDILQDTVRPAVKDYAGTTHTVIRDDNDTTNANSNLLKISFTEPMNGFATTTKAKIYIDGKEIDTANNNLFTDVKTVGKVSEHSVVSINIGNSADGLKLEKGEHTFAIVGAEDLNGNVVSDNTKEYKFTVVDPTEQASVTPEVTSVYQVADNAFKVVFNTFNVVAKTATTAVTIKKGAYDNDYVDIKVNGVTTTSSSGVSGTNILSKEIPTDTTNNIKAHTEWLVVVDATADTDATMLSYKGANVMSKDIEIENFQVFGGKDGKKTTKSLTFKKDITAPVVSTAQNAITSRYDVSDSKVKLNIKFNDAPFAEAAEIKNGTKLVTVKYVNDKGVTYSEDIATVLGTDKKSIDLAITNEDMLNARKDGLIPGGKYSIVLPDAVIQDEEESSPITSLKYKILDGLHPFVGKTVEYTVPGVLSVAGSVPQTTRGMIFTGYEAKKGIGTLASEVYAATTTTGAKKITLKDNQIVVLFDCDGSIDASTANNKDNYTLNGKVLPQGTTVEYREADINSTVGNEKFVLITLPDNTISLTGGQDFTVQNVANKEGYKMMPVADVITLADNTAPVIKAVEVNASNKITVTFSEEVDIKTTDMTQLARNFVITANGKTVSLLNAVVDTTNKKKMTITTADNFADSSLNVPVSIKIKKDSDGNIFIEDMAENKAAEMTFTK